MDIFRVESKISLILVTILLIFELENLNFNEQLD